MLSDSKSAVSKFSSTDEAQKLILEDNKNRCDFFKHFKYDSDDKLGSVSLEFKKVNRFLQGCSSDVYKC